VAARSTELPAHFSIDSREAPGRQGAEPEGASAEGKSTELTQQVVTAELVLEAPGEMEGRRSAVTLQLQPQRGRGSGRIGLAAGPDPQQVL
jgi:hypothetical protein